jgi:hypothetical protein
MVSSRGPVEPVGRVKAWIGEASHSHAREMREHLQARDHRHPADDAEGDLMPTAGRARFSVATCLALDLDRVVLKKGGVGEGASGALWQLKQEQAFTISGAPLVVTRSAPQVHEAVLTGVR